MKVGAHHVAFLNYVSSMKKLNMKISKYDMLCRCKDFQFITQIGNIINKNRMKILLATKGATGLLLCGLLPYQY